MNLADALVVIGNHEAVAKLCEPNIMLPLKLEGWMVIRTLKALELFEDVSKNRRGGIQEITISDERAIHGNTKCI